jgi:hypothetical protein
MFDCIVYAFYEHKILCVLMLFVRNLCSRHFHLFVRLLQFPSVGLEICFAKTCKLEKEELFFFIMLGSRGHCPRITRGLVALFFLLYSLTIFHTLVVYVAEVFSSSTAASFGSDDCTHSFFASGSTGCPSSYFVMPVVVLAILSLGSP